MPFRSNNRAAALALTVLVASMGIAAAQTVEVCQIVRTTPDAVTLQRGTLRVAAVVGHVLHRDDRVQTGAGGRATILCDTGLTMTVGPDTRIVLDRIMTDRGRGAGIRLLEGIAGFILPTPRLGGFVVRTPSAVAAVRSTQWAVAAERRATATFVRKGAVAVAGRDRGVVLSAGEGVDVGPQGNVGTVKVWGPARVEGFARRLGRDWQTPRR